MVKQFFVHDLHLCVWWLCENISWISQGLKFMLCAYLPKRYFCTYLISPDRFKIRISNFDTIIIHMNVVHVQKMVKFGSAVFFRSEWVNIFISSSIQERQCSWLYQWACHRCQHWGSRLLREPCVCCSFWRCCSGLFKCVLSCFSDPQRFCADSNACEGRWMLCDL